MGAHGRRRSPPRTVPARAGRHRRTAPAATPTTVIGGYVALTKPRIIELLLITTVPTMVLAEQGWPSTRLVIITLIGGTLAAGGANADQHVVDRDIDALMPRTQGRPLVTGAHPAAQRAVFAVALEVAAFAVLWAGANLLSAVLALSAAAVLRLRLHAVAEAHEPRRTSSSAAPPAPCPCSSAGPPSQDSLGWAPVVLFVVMFLWTPPHFWALADPLRRRLPRRRRADAAGGGHAARSRATDARRTRSVMVALHAACSSPVADLGSIYIVSAAVLGALFLVGTVALGKRPTPRRSCACSASITYVTLLFGAMSLDVLVQYGFS